MDRGGDNHVYQEDLSGRRPWRTRAPHRACPARHPGPSPSGTPPTCPARRAAVTVIVSACPSAAGPSAAPAASRQAVPRPSRPHPAGHPAHPARRGTAHRRPRRPARRLPSQHLLLPRRPQRMRPDHWPPARPRRLLPHPGPRPSGLPPPINNAPAAGRTSRRPSEPSLRRLQGRRSQRLFTMRSERSMRLVVQAAIGAPGSEMFVR